jgi:uncharacterized protein YndB with AHSA1/START domain
MSNNTVTLHKVIKASPEKIYRAFTDAAALASWLPPYGFLGKVHQLDVRVGGSYRMSFTNFTTGSEQFFGGTYLEKIDDPKFAAEMLTSVWITKVSTGTDLKITQENIPEAIPAEMCYLGWQDSLEKLTKLVESEIQDA